ncbi:hypothetical protein [Streptosporangium sp. NPDC087985]|uniref:hypothetical protein n=1 Tax=Streptosporangium sp. NPDC087985 TaxID=3366196 RepID=UPI0038261E1D
MTSRLPRRALALCAGGVLLLLAPVPAAHAEPVSPSTAEAWQSPTTARLSRDGSLSDVAGLSGTDVWAVGQQSIWDIWQSRSAITHWDGVRWTEVGIRNDPTGAGLLRSVAAASPTELWAVGEGHDSLPYLARGDGSAFDRVTVDELRVGDWLGGVAAIPDRMVAVGQRDKKPLVVTGTGGGRWKLAEFKQKGALYGVALSTKGDGWAVGETGGRPLITRLADGRWKAFRAPDIRGGYLRDIHLDGPKRALAVGGVYDNSGSKIAPLVLSWDGKQWRRLKPPGGDVRLYGVTGNRKGRFWISGVDLERPDEAFLLRYDGHTFKALRSSAAVASRTIRLQAVAYLPGSGTVLTVGHVVDADGRYSDVIERLGTAERAKP